MSSENHRGRIEPNTEAISQAATDPDQMASRVELARFVSQLLGEVGTLLHLSGHIIGSDRKNGVSPFGHGSDEVVAISLLLRIASQLLSAATDLFLDGRCYAAAALIRQMVEVEYLAWAFETRNSDAERWLRSTEKERQDFFKPAKLRQAAGGHFRSKDYGYHCELGGHPVPKATLLLGDTSVYSQLLLSDVLGHTGRIWNHLSGWARLHGETAILARTTEMSIRFQDWKHRDLLFDLPPPP